MAFLLYFFLASLTGERSKKSKFLHHPHILIDQND